MNATGVAAAPRGSRIGWGPVFGLVGLTYAVLVGGTGYGELVPVLWIPSAVMAICIGAAYLLFAPSIADRTDKRILVALLLFIATALLSKQPRQSLDAVLLVATYAGAVFVGRGLFSKRQARFALVRVLRLLSFMFMFIALVRWIPALMSWWSGADFVVLPPLNLTLLSLPWGHRYDLALACAMLYPAWWVGASTPSRRLLALLLGLPAGFIVLITGSRSVWLAIGVATIAVLILSFSRSWLRPARERPLLVGTALGAIAVLVALAMVSGLVDRALNGETLRYRGPMWHSLAQVWLSHPLVGYGPGSFPWTLQSTDYFQANAYAPRHPDSAVVQVMAEGGVLGLAAMTMAVGTLLSSVIQSRSRTALFALVAFAAGSLLGNPTDFAFVNAIAIGWVAYALPRPASPAPPRKRALAGSLGLVLLALITLAYSGTVAAAFAFRDAGSSVAEGSIQAAADRLDVAIALDPSMGIYWRDRGTAYFLMGNSGAAVADLRHAVELGPTDDAAWRALGLAFAAAGKNVDADVALTTALKLRRTPTNLLVDAVWNERRGRDAIASELLVEAVQAWPAIVGAREWTATLPSGTTTTTVIRGAADRWAAGKEMPEIESDQGIWLSVLSNRPELLAAARSRSSSPTVVNDAVVELLNCRNADGVLEHASGRDISTVSYWTVKFWADAQADRPSRTDAGMIQIMSGNLDFPSSFDTPLNPLRDNVDYWGYRRLSIPWPLPPDIPRLPNPDAALTRWYLDAPAAAESSGLLRAVPACRAPSGSPQRLTPLELGDAAETRPDKLVS